MAEDIFEVSARQGAEIAAKIARANSDAGQVLNAGMVVNYYDDIDFLYIGLRKPRAGLSIPLKDDASSVLSYDPETFEILSLEVPFFKEKRQQGRVSGPFWDEIAELLELHGPTVYVATKQDTELAGRFFRDLVSA